MTYIRLVSTQQHNLGMDSCTFLINRQRYTYNMNRNILHRIKWLAEHRPGAALDIAKKYGKLIKTNVKNPSGRSPR